MTNRSYNEKLGNHIIIILGVDMLDCLEFKDVNFSGSNAPIKMIHADGFDGMQVKGYQVRKSNIHKTPRFIDRLNEATHLIAIDASVMDRARIPEV